MGRSVSRLAGNVQERRRRTNGFGDLSSRFEPHWHLEAGYCGVESRPIGSLVACYGDGVRFEIFQSESDIETVRATDQ